MIILEIIGGIVLVILLIVAVGYLFLKFKFGKYLNAEPSPEPLTIHLVEDISPEWQGKSEVAYAIESLKSIGFEQGTAYTIHEMQEFYLQSFFKPSIVAVIYWHKIAGCWVDLFIKDKYGNEYTFSNAKMGGGMEARPECKKLLNANADIGELYSSLQSTVDSFEDEPVEISRTEFREYFEETYKKDMAWKQRKGGLSYDEFIKEANYAPFKTKDSDKQKAFIQTKEKEIFLWEDVAFEEFRKKSDLNDDAFYELEHKLLIVPFTTNASAYLRYLEQKDFISENQKSKLEKFYSKESDIFNLFDKLNDLLSPELRAKFEDAYDFPLKLRIYRMSEKMLR